jgi:hypothetical protein
MTDGYDVIQAFVDDEPFEPQALEAALADPDGRAQLIDLVVLRNLARQSVPPMPARVASSRSGRARLLAWLPAAAALAIVSGAGGYIAGGNNKMTSAPADVATETPVDNPQSSDAPYMSGSPADTAPAPAYVIRLEPGVDWTERTGGR